MNNGTNDQNSLPVNSIIQILEKHQCGNLQTLSACLEVLQTFGIEYKPINPLLALQQTEGENKQCIGFQPK